MRLLPIPTNVKTACSFYPPTGRVTMGASRGGPASRLAVFHRKRSGKSTPCGQFRLGGELSVGVVVGGGSGGAGGWRPRWLPRCIGSGGAAERASAVNKQDSTGPGPPCCTGNITSPPPLLPSSAPLSQYQRFSVSNIIFRAQPLLRWPSPAAAAAAAAATTVAPMAVTRRRCRSCCCHNRCSDGRHPPPLPLLLLPCRALSMSRICSGKDTAAPAGSQRHQQQKEQHLQQQWQQQQWQQQQWKRRRRRRRRR